MMEHENAKRDPDRRRLSVVNIVLAGFLVIAGFFLILEHRAHLLGWLPFLILLLCPLMHIFMHGGHGGSAEAPKGERVQRSEEHTSELQSLMRISYAVFCLKKKKSNYITRITINMLLPHTKCKINKSLQTIHLSHLRTSDHT